MKLLAIDPGKATGWAFFNNQSKLDACGVIEIDADFTNTNLTNIFEGFNSAYEPDLLVIEIPQIYSVRQWKGDPNDLIDLAVQAGQIIGTFSSTANIKKIRPHNWKGNLPKEICNTRSLSKLSSIESMVVQNAQIISKKGSRKMIKTLAHNMLDAIGIGL